MPLAVGGAGRAQLVEAVVARRLVHEVEQLVLVGGEQPHDVVAGVFGRQSVDRLGDVYGALEVVGAHCAGTQTWKPRPTRASEASPSWPGLWSRLIEARIESATMPSTRTLV